METQSTTRKQVGLIKLLGFMQSCCSPQYVLSLICHIYVVLDVVSNTIESKFHTYNFLPPETVVTEGNVFTSVCQEFCPQGQGLPSGGGGSASRRSTSRGVCLQGGWADPLSNTGYGQQMDSMHPT